MKVCSVCQERHDDSRACELDFASPSLDSRESEPQVPGFRLDYQISFRHNAKTYRARDVASGRTCLIKVVAADEDAAKQAIREAKIAANLFHPAIANFYDCGRLEDGRCFFVFEDIEGRPLREILDNGGIPELLDTIEIVREAAEALHAFHRSGLIHGAVHPRNIIMSTTAGGQMIVRVTDPDLGRLEQRSIISNRFLIDNELDSLRYFSPEQCAGEDATVQSDVYSLGIVFYEMLAGFTPFEASTAVGLIQQHTTQLPPDIRIENFNLRMLVTHALTEALQKQTRLRQPSVNTLARQLRHIEQLATHSSTPPPAGTVNTRPAPVPPAMPGASVPKVSLPAAAMSGIVVDLDDQQFVETPEIITQAGDIIRNDVKTDDARVSSATSTVRPRMISVEDALEEAAATLTNLETPAPQRPSRLQALKKKLSAMAGLLGSARGEAREAPAAFDDYANLVQPVATSEVGTAARVPKKIEWVQPEDDIPSLDAVQEVLALDHDIPMPVIESRFESIEISARDAENEGAPRVPEKIEWVQPEDDIPSLDAVQEVLAPDHDIPMPVIEASSESIEISAGEVEKEPAKRIPKKVKWIELFEDIPSTDQVQEVLANDRDVPLANPLFKSGLDPINVSISDSDTVEPVKPEPQIALKPAFAAEDIIEILAAPSEPEIMHVEATVQKPELVVVSAPQPEPDVVVLPAQQPEPEVAVIEPSQPRPEIVAAEFTVSEPQEIFVESPQPQPEALHAESVDSEPDELVFEAHGSEPIVADIGPLLASPEVVPEPALPPESHMGSRARKHHPATAVRKRHKKLRRQIGELVVESPRLEQEVVDVEPAKDQREIIAVEPETLHVESALDEPQEIVVELQPEAEVVHSVSAAADVTEVISEAPQIEPVASEPARVSPEAIATSKSEPKTVDLKQFAVEAVQKRQKKSRRKPAKVAVQPKHDEPVANLDDAATYESEVAQIEPKVLQLESATREPEIASTDPAEVAETDSAPLEVQVQEIVVESAASESNAVEFEHEQSDPQEIIVEPSPAEPLLIQVEPAAHEEEAAESPQPEPAVIHVETAVPEPQEVVVEPPSPEPQVIHVEHEVAAAEVARRSEPVQESIPSEPAPTAPALRAESTKSTPAVVTKRHKKSSRRQPVVTTKPLSVDDEEITIVRPRPKRVRIHMQPSVPRKPHAAPQPSPIASEPDFFPTLLGGGIEPAFSTPEKSDAMFAAYSIDSSLPISRYRSHLIGGGIIAVLALFLYGSDLFSTYLHSSNPTDAMTAEAVRPEQPTTLTSSTTTPAISKPVVDKPLVDKKDRPTQKIKETTPSDNETPTPHENLVKAMILVPPRASQVESIPTTDSPAPKRRASGAAASPEQSGTRPRVVKNPKP